MRRRIDFKEFFKAYAKGTVRQKRDYREFYDKESIELVREISAWVVWNFGYEF